MNEFRETVACKSIFVYVYTCCEVRVDERPIKMIQNFQAFPEHIRNRIYKQVSWRKICLSKCYLQIVKQPCGLPKQLRPVQGDDCFHGLFYEWITLVSGFLVELRTSTHKLYEMCLFRMFLYCETVTARAANAVGPVHFLQTYIDVRWDVHTGMREEALLCHLDYIHACWIWH